MSHSAIQTSASPRIGKYDVEAEIGDGNLVRVFRALDGDLGRPVTLKLLTDLADSALAKRFRAEVSCVGKLRSPSVIAIYELGEHVGFPFASMQVLGDDDLRQAILEQRPLSLLQKMLILWQIAEGLRETNLGGLAHVGLRPSGIALDGSGRAIIRDFGIVRLQPEMECEAAGYTSPEELHDAVRPDAICDIFAFGTIAYELLAGAHPFRSGKSGDAKIDFSREPSPLCELASDCPDALSQWIHRTIEKHRELRYQTPDDLLDDAEPILRELKRQSSLDLLSGAQRLIEAREVEQAHAMLREVLQLDPDNREAQRLRTGVRALLHAQTVRPRVEALLRQADAEAGAGEFRRAVELLESARSLDDSDAQVQTRLDEARSRLERSRRSAELVAQARQFMDRRAWNEAGTRILEALESDPANTEANELLRVVDEAIVSQEREAKIEKGLAEAKSLLLHQEFADAIALLVRLQQDCPGSALVDHWLDHARTQQAVVDRQMRLQARLRDARTFMAQRQYDRAVFELSGLSAEFSGDLQVSELLALACQARDREAAVSQARAQCQQFRRDEQFEKALEVLDSTLSAWPGDAVLTRLRREVAEQWRELKSTAEAGKALHEVQWLLDQGRPDLATQFLREKCREFPDNPGLASRLAEVEIIHQDWEKDRFIRDTLHRVADLEQFEQWAVALTVIDEALETHPAAPPLLEAAERLRHRASGEERRRKLSRRLDAISQKIAEQSWPQAVTLIEAALVEFPGEAELDRLRQTAEAGRRRAEAESIVREARHSLADGDPERAEEVLRQGLESLPEDPALRALQQELAADKKFREDWRAAQVLFGRREFQKAEKLLIQLAEHNRPEVELLLLKVREARAACDEDQFYSQGREKALKLIQQQQLEQASDLLRNLLTLFPGDPILERDLLSIQGLSVQGLSIQGLSIQGLSIQGEDTESRVPVAAPPADLEAGPVAGHNGLQQPASPVGPATLAASPVAPVHPVAAASKAKIPAPAPVARRTSASADVPEFQFLPMLRGRSVVIGASVLVLAASSSAALWKLSRHPSPPVSTSAKPSPLAPASNQVPSPAPVEAVASADPVASPVPPRPSGSAPSGGAPAKPEDTRASAPILRPFTAPPAPGQEVRPQNDSIPPPPGVVATASSPDTSAFPVKLASAPNAPAPPPEPVATPKAASPTPAPLPSGGRVVPARLIKEIRPIVPQLARQMKVSGAVNLEATVDKEGKVTAVKVISGHSVLVGAARNAVAQWRYLPATLNDQPIETVIEIKMLFDSGAGNRPESKSRGQ